MMKAFPLALICGLWLTACNPAANSPESTQNVGFESDTDDYTAYVNPMIGTKNMGHTFPGAAVPFGMVQLSPETNKLKMFLPDGTYNAEAYRYCSGYQFNDTTIFGFSHTHFSGTGHSDLGDILILPVVEPINNENPTVKSEKGFSDAFSHDDEKASPGFYSVRLKKNGIKAEMTATERVGFHRYTFPETDQAHLILDLMANIYDYDGKNVWTFLRVENDSTVTGYRQTTGWARTRTVYFAMKFSQPIKAYGRFRADATPYKGFYRKFNESENFPEMAGRELRAYFNFHTVQNEPLMLKVALSPVSTENALNNMAVEAPNWDFDGVKKLAQHKWNIELSKIKVETTTLADKTTFYTALYHTMLSPILYEDTDKSYRGLDQNNHRSEGFTNYTIFSLWDTYRALHPLLNLLHPQRNNDMVHSMLAHHDQSVHKMLPIWSHYANENWCMIGYHAVSVMADAVAKGTTNADFNRILDACVHTAEVRYFDGLGDYIDMGFVPEDKSSNAVSKTLEYAYNDWCIAQIAKKAGRMDVYQQFMARSESYRKVYNATSGYMQPRLSNGSWKKNFDPFDTHGQGFIEGNALNYGLYVPHQLDTMIAMMGGKEQFSNHLDMIFNTPIEDKYIIKNEDITRDGIIGNYVHGNEPGHHIPYLYNWTNDSWKTQERVRMILATMYSDKEDGLCGNDDAGQMSAWYIFSAMGFYPVLPGSTDYALGSPSVQKATIQLEDGKQWVVKTINQSADNVYVEKIFLNGEPLKTPSISHDVIKKGGEIIFYMTPQKPML
jgi:predicted alpha-1,2-mannosidase